MLEFFHNKQTCQSKITQCKYFCVTEISYLPHSKSVKRQDLQVQTEELLKCDWHLKEMVSKGLHDSVQKHSRVNQSHGGWVPQGPAFSYLFTYFTLLVSLSGIIITLLFFSPGNLSLVCIVCCKLLLHLLCSTEDVESVTRKISLDKPWGYICVHCLNSLLFP